MSLRRTLASPFVTRGWRVLAAAESRSSCSNRTTIRGCHASALPARAFFVSEPHRRRVALAHTATCAAGRRRISSSARREKVKMSFVEDDGNVVEVEAEPGKNLLEVAHENDVDLEGACGGDMACSTCHVILPQKYYDKLPDKEEEEDDMLDLAWGLTDTSRLGCQVKVTAEHEGMVIKIPEDSIDMS